MESNNKYSGYRMMEPREHQLLQLEAMKHVHQICEKNSISYYIIAGTLLGAVRHGGFIPWDDDIDIALMRNEYERFKVTFAEQCDKDKYFLQHYGTDKDFKPALMRVCIKNTILDTPETMHQSYCHNTYIDVFPLDNVPDNEQLRCKQTDRIISLKRHIFLSYYSYNENNKGVKIIREWGKQMLALINSFFYPKQKQRNLLIEEMTRYNGINTECVCSMASGYSYKKQSMPRLIYGKPTLITFEDTKFYGPEKADLYLRHLYGENYMVPYNKFKDGHGHNIYIKD